MIAEENGKKCAFWFPNGTQISDVDELMKWLLASGFSKDAKIRSATPKDAEDMTYIFGKEIPF